MFKRMKDRIVNFVIILMVAIVSVGFVSCGKTTDNEIDGGSYSREYSDYEERMISELTGTSWRYDKFVNGTKMSTEYAIITFAENEQLQVIDFKTRDGKYISTKEGSWYFSNNILVFLPFCISTSIIFVVFSSSENSIDLISCELNCVTLVI